jgi:nitrite transporter NirC
MPISIPEATRGQAESAAQKCDELRRRPISFAIQSLLAGVYIGVAVVLMLSATGPMSAAGHPMTKLVQGLVFGIALTLVVFAGAELTTGNMMTMIMGMFDRLRGARPNAVLAVIVLSFAGNLVGSIVFALLVHGSGVLDAGAKPGGAGPGAALLSSVFAAKHSEGVTALFLRGVLCNMLVTLGVWMAARTKSDVAKLALLAWVLLAFITTGFDHVVANMTVFSLAMFAGLPGATVGAFAWNMVWVGLGNLVGGGLIGAAYGYVGRAQSSPLTAPVVNDAPRASAAKQSVSAT